MSEYNGKIVKQGNPCIVYHAHLEDTGRFDHKMVGYIVKENGIARKYVSVFPKGQIQNGNFSGVMIINGCSTKEYIRGTFSGGGSSQYPDYLSFTSYGNSTIALTNNGGNAPVVYYSFDRENWTLWDYSAISLTNGHTVYMYGDNGGDGGSFSSSATIYSNFVVTGSITSNGNVMSLLGEDFENYTAVGQFCFYYLFNNCTALKSAPRFPAVTLASSCYRGTFRMAGIDESPFLSADPHKSRCYRDMFFGCNSLSKITFGGDEWNTSNAGLWVDGVAATGMFVCKSSLTIPVGTNGIPSGWTRVDL